MISTRGRYALRVMVDLAECEKGRFVPLKEIAMRQEISQKYLEIIVKDLVRAGLIEGVSGKGGGYRLVKDANEYTAGEILEVAEGTLASVACLEKGAKKCPRESVCRTLPLWKEYYEMTRDFFFGKKLSDLTEKEKGTQD